MSTPILATKLYIPPARSKVVVRLRLIEELNKSLSSGRRLTLISAPAGFGKTTLVSEWVTECGRPVAWLSLDEEDDDLTRFFCLLYLCIAEDSANHWRGSIGRASNSSITANRIDFDNSVK
jgi:LuxR family maltose regulon positive regulatory protein